jgi:outer membrane receptor protein involved in Fe transport
MTIRAEINNLLNKTNYQGYSGVQTSPFFGLPTRARDPRRVALSVRFDF